MSRFSILVVVALLTSNSYAGDLREPVSVTNASDRASTLVIGRISSSPRRHYDKLVTLNQRVVAGMADLGISHSYVVVARNPEEMRRLLEAGQVDYFSETVFAAMELENRGLAQISLREWKGGAAEYRSLIVVHAASPISSLDDLAGGSIVFEDRGSTSGFYLPYAYLHDHGLTLRAAHTATNTEHTLTYSFAGDETTVLARVIRGKADAGVISDVEWNNEKKAPTAFKRQLRVLAQTRPMARSVVAVRVDLDQRIKERLIQILIRLNDTEDDRNVLEKYFNVTKFDPLDETARQQLAYAKRNSAAFFTADSR